MTTMSSMYGIQPQNEMSQLSHIHGVCDPHMNSLSLQVLKKLYHRGNMKEVCLGYIKLKLSE